MRHIAAMLGQATPTALYSPLGADPDFADLVQRFVTEIGERVLVLQAASEAKNWQMVSRFAHQIKGAAGSYGFADVTPLAAKLEVAAKLGACEVAIVAALDDLQDICSRLRSGTPETS